MKLTIDGSQRKRQGSRKDRIHGRTEVYPVNWNEGDQQSLRVSLN